MNKELAVKLVEMLRMALTASKRQQDRLNALEAALKQNSPDLYASYLHRLGIEQERDAGTHLAIALEQLEELLRKNAL